MRYGIARLVGSWVSVSGHRLRIRRVRRDQTSVDFFGPSGHPVCRPHMDAAPPRFRWLRITTTTMEPLRWSHGNGAVGTSWTSLTNTITNWTKSAKKPSSPVGAWDLFGIWDLGFGFWIFRCS